MPDQHDINESARRIVSESGGYGDRETLPPALDRLYPDATDEQIEAGVNAAVQS